MKQIKQWIWLVGAPALIAGCATANEPKTGSTSAEPLTLNPGTKVSTEGILDYGTVVFAENPTTALAGGRAPGTSTATSSTAGPAVS